MDFINPNEVVKNFGLRPGMVAADFGCGGGIYSAEMATIVKDAGVVYALDVQKEMIESAGKRAATEGLKNVRPIWVDLDLVGGSKLGDGVLDFALVSNTLFQSENKIGFMGEVYRALKNGGRVAVIDWQPAGEKMGPLPEQRMSRQDVETLCLRAGFFYESDFPTGKSHYGLIFKKP